MADIKTEQERSKNMAAIRGKDTKPELLFRKKLHAMGYRYSLHSAKVPGHPDLFLKKYNTAVFIHGCFWHRHKNCKYSYMPKSRVEFWTSKFERNILRDQEVVHELQDRGIRCLIVWECSIRKIKKPDEWDRIFSLTENFLHSDTNYLEVGNS